MAIYLLCFGVSCFIIFCIGGAKSRSPRFILGSVVALLIPCLLAAFRAEQIGTDVRGYITPLYNAAKESASIKKYWEMKIIGSYRNVNDFELGFIILVYISAKFFKSKQILLGMIQLLTVVPVYFGIKRFENRVALWFGMLVYYLMYYNATLNMMRQWIAMGLLIYAFKDLLEKKYIRYIIVILLGMLFHRSALIGVAFIALRVFFDIYLCRYSINIGIGLKLSSDFRKVLLLLLICCIVFYVPEIVLYILRLTGLSSYRHYFYNSQIHFGMRQFIVRSPILVLLIINIKKMQCQMDYKFLFGMAICDTIFSNYVSGGEYMYRVACWFAGFNIYSYPLLLENLKVRYRKIMKVAVIAYLILYWWYYFCYKRSHQTVPYISVWK